MFASQTVRGLLNLAPNLSHPDDWDPSFLQTFEYHNHITAIATEPTSGLFAVGTVTGTVHLYGAPGVESHLKVTDPPTRIKCLQFASSTCKLLCIDQESRLFVWDLSKIGKPSLQKITRFSNPVCAILTSPSHTHAFVALANGEIKTYDLLCLRTSQYTIPNLWTLYEEISLTKDISASGESPPSDMIIDIVIHPRDLNLIFVAYEGGVIVSDLKEQKPVRTFELTLQPGAPGASGYTSKDILLPRRQYVTAIALHPSGHLLAIGYADGSIGFWSLDDEDKPLVLRTVDSPEGEDLNSVDPDQLDAALGQTERRRSPAREPIFKLAWSGFPNSSDPRGGDTVLTVSGGLTTDSQGVTALLLPPLQPPAPPVPTSPNSDSRLTTSTLHPETRTAICSSLYPKDNYFYNAAGPVQDFLLFPRGNPHFSSTYDPSTVLILSDSEIPDVRICEAYEFPPPSFVEQPVSPIAQGNTDIDQDVNPEDDELAKTLQEMMLTIDPRPAMLPVPLWNVLGQDLVRLDKHSYETLLVNESRPVDGEVPFPTRCGIAWSEDPEDSMRYAKKQPNRILISRLRDLSIRFLDLSSQLLVSTGPNAPRISSFPSSIPQLTIELIPILLDPTLGLTGSTQYEERLTHRHRIEAVHFTLESLECVAVLSTQAVILYRLDVPDSAKGKGFGQQPLADTELVSLMHIGVRKGLRFSPVVAIKPDKTRGIVTSCAHSDAGFLAVAYTSGVLLVVDLRGPRIILRYDPATHKSSGFLHRHSDEPIQSLTWACCALETDRTVRLRLVCTAASGHTTIYTLENDGPSNWTVADNPATADGSAKPLGSFILDATLGTPCHANRDALSSILAKVAKNERKVIWVSVGAKSARSMLNINGERIAKTEFGSKTGLVEHAEIVEWAGSYALVAFTNLGYALMYSLPHLEHVKTEHVRPSGFPSPPNTDDSGDYIVQRLLSVPPGSTFPPPVLTTELYSLLAAKRAPAHQPPLVDLARGRGAIPPQPQPVSLAPPSVMSSVLGYIGSFAAMSSAGDEIDALLAGPDRPVPAPKSLVGLPSMVRAGPTESGPSGSSSQSRAATTAGMTSGVADLYNRLGTAFAERSEKLSDLQQTLDSVGQGSKNLLTQAKRITAQQGAKRWFGL